MRIVGRSLGALSARASLRAGEAWFLGSTLPSGSFADRLGDLVDREAVQALESFAYDDDLRDMLPYVLDAHGPGSRASVMKDPGTQKSRQAKRASGIFYTPSDVAEYIAGKTLGEPSLWPYPGPRVLDPSCGSGVFLKAILDLTVRRTPGLDRLAFVQRSLHGIDVNPLAVEAACFVLLHECLAAGWRRSDESPWSRWHRIRCNLCVADALTFQVADLNHDCADALARVRSRLDDGYLPPAAEQAAPVGATTLFSEGRSLGSVFPALAAGADVVIGNPPYAKIGPRADAAALERRFASISARTVAGSDYFPVFVEMMWRLARPGGSASGMVVPLSLACSRRSQMSVLRRAIAASGGQWRFAFFDREPHALFGEEVKTRNTIAFRHDGRSDAGSTAAAIETGPLRKWTSRQRNRLFDSIDFTPISDNGISITTGIPKLDGAESALVFGRLARLTSRLREMCSSVSSCLPADVARGDADACVFVAGTAYNFLNVFRPHRRLPAQRAPWSASMVQSLEFGGEEQAARGFALLCSRISYWLWRVNEDGFHVSRSFLLELPFNDRTFDKTERETLTQLGTRLWDRVQSHQIVSINGGRQTVAYRPDTGEEIRDEIDALILAAIGVDPSFGKYLREFTRTVVTVDAQYDGRQSRLRFC